jgi:hypothetical protein
MSLLALTLQAFFAVHCHSHSGARSRYCLTIKFTWRPSPKFHDDSDILQ